MEHGRSDVPRHGGRNMGWGRRRRPSQTEKFVAIGLAILAIASPLYVDRAPAAEVEDSAGSPAAAWLLPVVLVLLILVINFANFFDSRYTRFDPYWIHRVWGSSGGIVVLLLLLVLVLRCKASVTS